MAQSGTTGFGWQRTSTRPLLITLIDGPNMPNLGNRNKRVYGPIASITALHDYMRQLGEGMGVTIEALASNHEGEILDAIHASAAKTDAYILNPAGLTKTGEPTRHALEETGRPWVETHFSNIPAPLGQVEDSRGGLGNPTSPALRPGCRWACATTATSAH